MYMMPPVSSFPSPMLSSTPVSSSSSSSSSSTPADHLLHHRYYPRSRRPLSSSSISNSFHPPLLCSSNSRLPILNTPRRPRSSIDHCTSSSPTVIENGRGTTRINIGEICRCTADFISAGREGATGWRVAERVKVVAMVALVMSLCNADRVVMSVAVVPLAATYGWSTSFLGIVQSSFLWGYLVSSVGGGALADRYGGKPVLACGVALWSLATFLTPLAADHSTAMLLAVRVLFGLAEGVAMPSMNILLSGWFPSHERATAVGISMAGFHLGNVISFLATPLIMSSLGISGPFALFASLGFVWLSAWAVGIANDPLSSPFITQDELQLIRAGKSEDDPSAAAAAGTSRFPSIRHLLSKLPTWAIIFANVTNNWGYFVLLSWMPVYFKTVYNVNLKQAAWFSAIPWGMMAISGYIAGAASDLLIKSDYPVTRVRKVMQSIGFMGPGISLLCLNFARSPAVAAAFLTIALSLSSFSQAGFLLNMQDIAPKYAGLLHGITNSVGTLAAIISTAGAGYFVQRLGSFQAFLTLTSFLYFITTIFWDLYATGEQVFF